MAHRLLVGFTLRIQDGAQFIEGEIGYLVFAFPAQVNSCRVVVGFSRMLTTAALTSVFTLIPFFCVWFHVGGR